MDFFLTNTLTKEKELFIPQKKDYVSMYQCGPTLYWDQHIGNLRSVVLADFMVRSLKAHSYDVTFVRNYTDVGHLSGDNDGDADQGEDRMEKASKRESLAPEEIAYKYRKQYEIDIAQLNTLPPTHTPSATEFIPHMQKFIQTLLEKGFAYSTPLAIYFDISKVKEYTKLSHQSLDDLLANSGHGTIVDEQKKSMHDFALWFFKAGDHENALQTWQSPFTSSLIENGEGFPGWHIECSAMAKELLGETIDIHMGGIEHISIHHTNEIAQSESAHGVQFAKYWLHNEHLLVDGTKMSKSAGTSYTLSDVIAKGFDPLDLRYFFLQAHYRSKQNFTWDALESSKVALRRLRDSVAPLPEGGTVDSPSYTIFLAALADDINTPKALAQIHAILKASLSDADKKATILACDAVLGLSLARSQEVIEVPENVQKMLQERADARKNKDWQRSDELRHTIEKEGFSVQDIDGSYTITRLS